MKLVVASIAVLALSTSAAVAYDGYQSYDGGYGDDTYTDAGYGAGYSNWQPEFRSREARYRYNTRGDYSYNSYDRHDGYNDDDDEDCD